MAILSSIPYNHQSLPRCVYHKTLVSPLSIIRDYRILPGYDTVFLCLESGRTGFHSLPLVLSEALEAPGPSRGKRVNRPPLGFVVIKQANLQMSLF